MKTVCSPEHRRRDPKTELSGGQLVTPFDSPDRVDRILAALAQRGFSPPRPADPHGLAPVRRVHAEDYLAFLATCWDEWIAAGNAGEAIATVWPSRAMPAAAPPRAIDGKLGYYALAAETSICAGTWAAAQAAADVASTAQALVAGGDRAAFALCRPPGHHAARDMYGGYCFLNNAAIAAQAFIAQGADRVAIVDVDFHHGNGTQQIFYRRADVLTVSLHGDPADAFPYFLGRADERGEGPGDGFNQNYPLPPGTAYDQWRAALEDGLTKAHTFGAAALVVSLGVDTFERDPISFFRLRSEDYLDLGARLAALQRPTVFVMEGGYAVDEIGVNTVNVLEGFSNG